MQSPQKALVEYLHGIVDEEHTAVVYFDGHRVEVRTAAEDEEMAGVVICELTDESRTIMIAIERITAVMEKHN